MRKLSSFLLAALLPLLFLFPYAGAHAQSRPEYLTLGHANGALYRPDNGAARVAFVVMHRVNDFMRHPACTQLAERGFMVRTTKPSSTGIRPCWT